MTPVTATLEAAAPDIIPTKVLNTTAVFAPAALKFLVKVFETLKKKSPAPNSVKMIQK